MHKRTTSKVFGRSKELHRNMTPAEVKLWAHLRAHRMKDVHFRTPDFGYPFNFREVLIVDYSPQGTMCAPRRKLIIELDGSQHLEQEEYDLERTAFLESKGCRVLRFWNNEVASFACFKLFNEPPVGFEPTSGRYRIVCSTS